MQPSDVNKALIAAGQPPVQATGHRHTITLPRDVGPLWQWLNDNEDTYHVRMVSYPAGHFEGQTWIYGTTPWVFDLTDRGLARLAAAFAQQVAV